MNTIEYRLSFEEYSEAASSFRKVNGLGIIRRIMQITTFGLGCICLYLYIEISDIFLLFLSIFLILLSILDFAMIISRIVSLTIYRRTNKYNTIQKVRFTSEGLEYNIENAFSKITWTFYEYFFETKLAFVLVYEKSLYSIFPKSAIAEKDIEELRSLLKSHLREK